MTDNKDELLLKQFFDEHRIDVSDDDFSRRVMRRLPDRKRRISRIWTAVCAAVVLVFLVRNDFLTLCYGMLKGLVCDISTCDAFMQNPLLTGFSVLFLLCMGGWRLVMEEMNS